MRIIRRLIVVVALLFGAGENYGSTSPQPHEPDDLVKWVLQTGKPSILRARVAMQLGAGDQDISVIERGLRVTGDKTTHVIGVRLGPQLSAVEFIFIARIIEEDGSGIIWKSSGLGQLQSTIVMTPNGNVKQIANDTQLGEFLSEKEYFRRKMHDKNFQ